MSEFLLAGIASGSGSQGSQGSPGVTGPQGSPGVTGVTGAAGPGINSFGVFGPTPTGANLASGWMVKWSTGIVQPTGAIGWTSVGTAAGWITVASAGYYDVQLDVVPTGTPTGAILATALRFGATGGPGGGLNSGSGLSSLVEVGGLMNQSITNGGLVYLPQNASIESYVYPLFPPSLASGISIAATGTAFSIFKVA